MRTDFSDHRQVRTMSAVTILPKPHRFGYAAMLSAPLCRTELACAEIARQHRSLTRRIGSRSCLAASQPDDYGSAPGRQPPVVQMGGELALNLGEGQ